MLFDNKDIKIENEKLCKLYSIVYIKIYLNKLVNLICTNYEMMGDINPIINTLRGFSLNNFRKVIKIYTLKLLFNFFNRDWNAIHYFDFQKHQIDIFEEDLFKVGGNEIK